MKKYMPNETSTCYVFRDQVAMLKRLPDGQEKLYVVQMDDVNDSELFAHPKVAEWVHSVAKKELEIRDENGKVVSIEKEALSQEELWLAGVWLKICEQEAEEDKSDWFDKPMSKEDKKEFKRHLIEDVDGLSREDKIAILKGFGINPNGV